MKKILSLFLIICNFSAVAQIKETDTRSYELDSATVTSSIPLLGKGNNYLYTPDKSMSVISIIGEPDVVRQVATLPGVSFGLEGGLGLYIRGGNAGTSKIEIDGVPLYNATHMFGLFSAIYPEMISVSKAYTGGFSSSSSNFTSGLISSTLKSEQIDKVKYSISISPFIEGIYLETPGRLQLRMGGRYSPLLQIGNAVFKAYDSYLSTDGFVYDYTLSGTYSFNDKSKLSFMAFSSMDNTNLLTPDWSFAMGWKSNMASLAWSKTLSNTTSLNVKIHYSGAASKQSQSFSKEGEKSSSYSINNNIFELASQASLSHRFWEKLNFMAGAELLYMLKGLNVSLFSDVQLYPAPFLDISAGYRHTFHFNNSGFRTNFDLHAKADVDLCDNLGIEFSFDRQNQYFHVLEGLPTGWAMNLSVPINKKFPEETSNLSFIGLYSNFNSRDYNYWGSFDIRFNLGAYFKTMNNLVSYTSSANMFNYTTISWEEETDCGKGKSYGLEASIGLSSNRFSMNTSYTLSKTDRLFPEINEGKVFPFKFDRPHILNHQMDFKFIDRVNKKGIRHSQSLYTVVNYSSGNLMTISLRQYEGLTLPHLGANQTSSPEQIKHLYNRTEMSDINGFRLPDYFRIDIGWTLKIQRLKTAHAFTLSVFNVLNRHNPYLIYNDFGEWKQVSIMPVMPSVRYKIDF